MFALIWAHERWRKENFEKLVFLIHKTDDSYPIQLNLHVTFSRIIRGLWESNKQANQSRSQRKKLNERRSVIKVLFLRHWFSIFVEGWGKVQAWSECNKRQFSTSFLFCALLCFRYHDLNFFSAKVVFLVTSAHIPGKQKCSKRNSNLSLRLENIYGLLLCTEELGTRNRNGNNVVVLRVARMS